MTTKRRYVTRHAALKNERSSWLPHWQELAENFLPRRGRWLYNSTSDTNKGDKRNQKIMDATVRDVVKTNSAGMMSGLTSPSRPWFRLVTPNPDLMEFGPVRQWLYIAEIRMREWFSKSNLYSVLPTVYQELSVFGTSAIGEFRSQGTDDQRPPVFYGYPIGSYCLAQSPEGEINTFPREFDMTVDQLVRKFGIDAVSETVRNQYNNGHLDQWVKVTHFVEHNPDADEGLTLDRTRRPWRSVWFENSKSTDDDKFLLVDGFYEMPIFAPRWETTSEDAYGTSCPGIDVLGTAKGLQIQTRRKAQAVDKLVDPPLQAPTALKGKVISMLPGEVTYVDQSQGMQGVRSLYDFRPDLNAMLEDIQDLRGLVHRMFLTDLFRLISNTADTSERTAYEVAQLHEEKLLMLGPVLENLNKGLLKPMIDRTFAMMLRSGLLPEPPEELRGVELKVEYISILAQAQRMVALGGIERFAGFVGNLAQYRPEVLDKFDADQSVDEYGEALGIPPALIRSDDDVAAIREQRAAQQRAQAIAENAAPMAKAAKDLSETQVEGDNALTRLTQAAAG